MHPHTQFAGNCHPSGPGPCRLVEPLHAPLPRRAEQVHCGSQAGILESGEPALSCPWYGPYFLLLVPCTGECPGAAEMVLCNACYRHSHRSHRTPHGQVQRPSRHHSVQGEAGKAKGGPPFSITRSSLHRACRPALVPVSMAWAAACMLQGNALALGASRSSPIPIIPTLTRNAPSHLLPCAPPRYLSILRGSMSLAKSILSAPTTASSRCTVRPLWGIEAGM